MVHQIDVKWEGGVKPAQPQSMLPATEVVCEALAPAGLKPMQIAVASDLVVGDMKGAA